VGNFKQDSRRDSSNPQKHQNNSSATSPKIPSHDNVRYVLDPHDENVWADHILKLAKNPHESERMGKNGNKLLKTRYTQDNMYQKIIKLYDDVLKL